MTLQQLEYIIAVDQHRHFVTASEKCFVTQPTLSMMIKKLEEELEVQIFDRSKQPVTPTPAGEKIIRQAHRILNETKRMTEMLKEDKKNISGELRLGVIPTLAPYVIPLFVGVFTRQYPEVDLSVTELITEQITEKINRHELDAGLLVTPLQHPEIKEQVLFYEKFFAYVSEKEKISRKKYILPEDIDPDKLWLLEEGHCFRSQVMNFCELKRKSATFHFHYEAGSIETLIKMVEKNSGITIIPELAMHSMTSRQKKNVRHFKSPEPVRQVSLVCHQSFYREKLLDALKNSIIENLQGMENDKGKKEIIRI